MKIVVGAVYLERYEMDASIIPISVTVARLFRTKSRIA